MRRWRHSRRIWRRLTSAAQKAPLTLQSAIAGLLYSGGDCAAQWLEKAYGVQSLGKTEHNYERTLRMGTFGLFFAGPILGLWYWKLQRMTSIYRYSYVPLQTSSGSGSWISTVVRGSYRREQLDNKGDLAREVLVKVVFDNLFFQAAFLNLYLFVMSMMEGRSLRESYLRCKRDFHDAWGYSMLFWVPAQAVNFSLLPPQHHALVVSVLNMMWKTFLSLLYHARDYGAGHGAPAAELASALHVTPVAGEVRDLGALWRQHDELRRLLAEFTREEQQRDRLRQQQLDSLLAATDAQTRQLQKLVEASVATGEE